MGEHVNNTGGKYLKWWLDKNDFKYRVKLIGPNEPTYSNTNSYIDLGLLTQY